MPAPIINTLSTMDHVVSLRTLLSEISIDSSFRGLPLIRAGCPVCSDTVMNFHHSHINGERGNCNPPVNQ
jgi:hypothetical protein